MFIAYYLRMLLWLVWLSGLGTYLWTERSPVQLPVRAHAWVVGQLPSWGHMRDNWLMSLSHISVSLPLFLPPFSLSKNKYNLKNNKNVNPFWSFFPHLECALWMMMWAGHLSPPVSQKKRKRKMMEICLWYVSLTLWGLWNSSLSISTPSAG